MLSIMRRRTGRALVALVLVAALTAAPLVAAEPADASGAAPSCPVESFAASANRNAGGWGLRSVIIFALSAGVREFCESRRDGTEFQVGDVVDFLGRREVWGGLVGDLALSAIVARLAPALPGGAFLKTFVMIGSGFAGFELGSGRFQSADWLSIGAQTLAATVTQLAVTSILMSVGFPAASLVATVASIGAALGAAWLLEKFRGREVMEAEERAAAPAAADLSSVSSPQAPSSSGEAADADALAAAYRRFVEATTAGDGVAAAARLAEYRSLRDAVTAGRRDAATVAR